MSATETFEADPRIFWAKLDKKAPDTFHPLICHMLDIAAVARALWRDALPRAARERLQAVLGLPKEQTETWVGFLAGLHDLGKGCPVFQQQDAARELRGLYAPYKPPPPNARAPHGTVTARELPPLLRERYGLPAPLASALATVIGGHHGIFPSSADTQAISPDEAGRGRWEVARAALLDLIAKTLGVDGNRAPQRLDNANALLLAGFVSVADWIGSNQEFFPYAANLATEARDINPAAYLIKARAQAALALDALGWTGWSPPDSPLTFEQLFPLIPGRRPLQEAAVAIAERMSGPGIAIAEAPTGEGKTEAALYLVDHWTATTGTRGCYVALPTQATSNQMFSRVRTVLRQRYPGERVQLQLLHGHAALSAEFQELRDAYTPSAVFGDDGHAHGADGAVVAAEWFTYRKRGLLAPFGVGTVDQALLSVLQTRHMFVRLFGLAHKPVIIDEVHAYDTYMSTLLRRLLEWLGALGSPVVLLSATLPAARRRALLAAYACGAGWPAPELPEVQYPRITWAAGGSAGVEEFGASSLNTRTIALRSVDGALPAVPGTPFALGDQLKAALTDGGCAAVICNTVRRAQEVYRALHVAFKGEELKLSLFHARFRYRDRAERERDALQAFGKLDSIVEGDGAPAAPVDRPFRAVLVATQVIEQSLDLDFDLMVSDFAPVDLLLQRAGRLHRHDRPLRPAAVSTPELWLCAPEQLKDSVPGFDSGTGYIYDAHVLLRSWLALHDRSTVEVPADVEALIGAVYDDDRPCPDGESEAVQAAWAASGKELERARAADEQLGMKARIRPPFYEDDILQAIGGLLEEDNPEVHTSLRANTRLGDPGMSVILLTVEERKKFAMDEPPNLAAARFLLERSVAITHRGVVNELLKQEPPSAWERSALLRHCRLVALDENRRNTVGRYTITLDDERGVLIAAAGTAPAEED